MRGPVILVYAALLSCARAGIIASGQEGRQAVYQSGARTSSDSSSQNSAGYDQSKKIETNNLGSQTSPANSASITAGQTSLKGVNLAAQENLSTHSSPTKEITNADTHRASSISNSKVQAQNSNTLSSIPQVPSIPLIGQSSNSLQSIPPSSIPSVENPTFKPSDSQALRNQVGQPGSTSNENNRIQPNIKNDLIIEKFKKSGIKANPAKKHTQSSEGEISRNKIKESVQLSKPVLNRPNIDRASSKNRRPLSRLAASLRGTLWNYSVRPTNRAAPKRNTVLKHTVPSNNQIAPKNTEVIKNRSTLEQSNLTKSKGQTNTEESKQSNFNLASRQAQPKNEPQQQNINNQEPVSNFNVRVSKTSKKALSKKSQQSSSKRKKASQNLKIIILHGGATPQPGTHFKKTVEANQRSRMSKSEESSKSESKQASFDTGSKSGTFSESLNSTSAKHREVDASQRAAVRQTAGRTEILLSQQTDARRRQSKSESYARDESLSESYSGRVAASGPKEALAAAGSLAGARAASQTYSTSSASSEKSSKKYEREQQSSVSSTVEQVVIGAAAG